MIDAKLKVNGQTLECVDIQEVPMGADYRDVTREDDDTPRMRAVRKVAIVAGVVAREPEVDFENFFHDVSARDGYEVGVVFEDGFTMTAFAAKYQSRIPVDPSKGDVVALALEGLDKVEGGDD